jgi:hypothetical protein
MFMGRLAAGFRWGVLAIGLFVLIACASLPSRRPQTAVVVTPPAAQIHGKVARGQRLLHSEGTPGSVQLRGPVVARGGRAHVTVRIESPLDDDAFDFDDDTSAADPSDDLQICAQGLAGSSDARVSARGPEAAGLAFVTRRALRASDPFRQRIPRPPTA